MSARRAGAVWSRTVAAVHSLEDASDGAAIGSARRYVRFPPGRGNIVVPVSCRAATVSGLSLYAPCKPATMLAHRVASAMTGIVGGRVLPGGRISWSPPTTDLLDAVREAVGWFDDLAVFERAQSVRSGLTMLLLRRGRPLAKVRASINSARLQREYRFVEAADDVDTLTFRVPRPLALDETAGWTWAAYAPLPGTMTRPEFRPALGAVTGEIRAALAGALDGTAAPPGWEPMHGDLTPWNLRRAGGVVWLLDWEDAGWGPSGADDAYFRVSMAALSRAGRVAVDPLLASFWLDRLRRRLPASVPGDITFRMVSVLEQSLRDREPPP